MCWTVLDRSKSTYENPDSNLVRPRLDHALCRAWRHGLVVSAGLALFFFWKIKQAMQNTSLEIHTKLHKAVALQKIWIVPGKHSLVYTIVLTMPSSDKLFQVCLWAKPSCFSFFPAIIFNHLYQKQLNSKATSNVRHIVLCLCSDWMTIHNHPLLLEMSSCLKCKFWFRIDPDYIVIVT